DRVLKAIAGYAHDNLRRYDQVFRYGGEEFVLLLPNTTIINAKRVLDRVRRSIKRHRIKIGKGHSLRVSASFGVAVLPAEGPVKDAIEYADKAMYEAKKAGRNRVCVWQPDDNPKGGG
ncbi:MAG: diguanylate cyclase, partial [Rhodospirillales bacterium]